MPILREYQLNEARSNQALEGIYSTIVLKDILLRNPQADQSTLEKLILFLCSNIGGITSPNSIGNILSQEGNIGKGKGGSIASKTAAIPDSPRSITDIVINIPVRNRKNARKTLVTILLSNTVPSSRIRIIPFSRMKKIYPKYWS